MALHAARRIALQEIFALLFHGGDCQSVLQDTQDFKEIGKDQWFVDRAIKGVSEKQTDYALLLSSLSPERELDRVPVLNRAILYLAFHELSQPGAIHAVIVNEAVELAKRFGEESDGRFVNGVLARVIDRELL